MCTVTWNEFPLPAETVPRAHETRPLAPTAGVLQVAPLAATKVAPAGRVNRASAALASVPAPFLTWNV